VKKADQTSKDDMGKTDSEKCRIMNAAYAKTTSKDRGLKERSSNDVPRVRLGQVHNLKIHKKVRT
jgi:hypothetical protein